MNGGGAAAGESGATTGGRKAEWQVVQLPGPAHSRATNNGGGGEVSEDREGKGEGGTEGYGGRSSDALAEVRQRRGGERRPRLDPSALHEGQQLVGDLGQDVFGQPGHAEDLVPRPVDVVSERDELEAGGQEGDGSHSNPQPRPPDPIRCKKGRVFADLLLHKN